MSRLADAITALLRRELDRRTRRVGTVTGVDGTRVVVNIAGDTRTLPRLKSYTTPANGDIVHIDTSGDGWLVLGPSA